MQNLSTTYLRCCAGLNLSARLLSHGFAMLLHRHAHHPHAAAHAATCSNCHEDHRCTLLPDKSDKHASIPVPSLQACVNVDFANQIILDERIGSGAFGSVYRGAAFSQLQFCRFLWFDVTDQAWSPAGRSSVLSPSASLCLAVGGQQGTVRRWMSIHSILSFLPPQFC